MGAAAKAQHLGLGVWRGGGIGRDHAGGGLRFSRRRHRHRHFGRLLLLLACAYLKYKLRYDDALDVFGIHGVGGLLGAILTGVFALEEIGNSSGAVEGNLIQVWVQIKGVLVVAAWCAIGTTIILFGIRVFTSLRVSEEDEAEGLDYSQHGEAIGADG